MQRVGNGVYAPHKTSGVLQIYRFSGNRGDIEGGQNCGYEYEDAVFSQVFAWAEPAPTARQDGLSGC